MTVLGGAWPNGYWRWMSAFKALNVDPSEVDLQGAIQMPAGQVKDALKAHCSNCGGFRNCDVAGEHAKNFDHGDTSGGTTWRILVCRGCDAVFCQTESWFSEDFEQDYDESGDPVIIHNKNFSYWPAILKRKAPEWLDFDFQYGETDQIAKILYELYAALENDLIRIASIAVRTAFDVTVEYLKIDSDTVFAQKLDTLVSLGHISTKDRTRLETIIEGGNAATHRGWAPDAAALVSMVEILEQFIHDAVVLPGRKARLDGQASKLKPQIPPKAARKSKPPPNKT